MRDTLIAALTFDSMPGLDGVCLSAWSIPPWLPLPLALTMNYLITLYKHVFQFSFFVLLIIFSYLRFSVSL